MTSRMSRGAVVSGLGLAFMAMAAPASQAQFLMDATPVSACAGTFTDSGGNAAPYANSEVLGPKTFTPSAGTNLAIDFTFWAVEGGTTCQFDALTIYDGPTTADPVIGTFCGSTGSPGTVISTHPTGSLTFEWVSDTSVTLDGWEATVICPTGTPTDDCTAAFGLPGSGTRNLGGTAPDGSASCDAVGGTDDWFSFTAASNGTLSVDTLGSTIDTVLSIHDSCGGTELACNDDSVGFLSALALPMTAGQSVVVRVADKGNPASTGQYTINSAFIGNDNCADAEALAGGFATPGTVAGTAADGGNTCDAGSGSDVWYSYTATATSGTLDIAVTGAGGLNTFVSTHSACPGNAGNETACGANAASLAVTLGQVVTIRVAADSTGAQAGDFTITATETPDPPANDDCANAELLPNGFQTVDWNNVGATTDGADATGFCDYGASGTEINENDVWYLWTPDASGCVYMSHFGLAGVDTRLTLYDVTTCPDDPANIVACVDDEVLPIAIPFEAGMDVEVSAGTQYLIRCGTFSPFTAQGAYQMVIAAGPQADVNNTSGAPQVGAPGCAPAPTFPTACFGDGGDQMGCTPCPCGNESAIGAGTGCQNSSGVGAELLPSGSASVTAMDPDDLRFEMAGGTPSSFAVLTSGNAIAPGNAMNPCFGMDSGVQSAVLDGLRCAVQSTQRHGGRPVAADGTVGVSTNGWGGASGPPTGLADQGGFTAGQTRHYQVFYRELPGQVCLTEQNTTQAVTVTFEP